MAHLLQGLAAFALTISLAGAQTAGKAFSHRAHLALKLDCSGCHADFKLPRAELCSTCHKEAVTIKASAKLRVAKFSHPVHAKFGNIAPILRAAIAGKSYLGTGSAIEPFLNTKNACAGCHHGIEQSVNVAAASVFPRMADCLTCHNQIDPPFSCEKCHANVEALKPASHVEGFLDFHNRKDANLDKESCAICHGRKFSCLGCHQK